MTTEKGYQSLKAWKQINELLEKPVPKDLIQKKDARKGIFGDYISGQAAIMLANQLFGSSGWEHRIDKGRTSCTKEVPRRGYISWFTLVR